MAVESSNNTSSASSSTHDERSVIKTDATGYRDYSNEVEGRLTLSSHSKNGANSEQQFPVKLHYMLSDMEADGLGSIVSWQPHGRCFIVHEVDEFVSKILPMWFRQTKISSFQRQLNLYGFKRITTGPDKGAHYHELFLRGKRHLAHRIHRVKIKGSGARKPARPHEEPDFYKMPFLPSHASPSPPMTNPVAETITIPRTNNTTTLGNIDHPVMPNLYTQLLASAAGTSNVNNHHNSTIYYPLQSSSSSSVATSGMSLDQLLRQCPTWVPPSLAGSLPPHVLAALVKEGVDSATLWNQFRG